MARRNCYRFDQIIFLSAAQFGICREVWKATCLQLLSLKRLLLTISGVINSISILAEGRSQRDIALVRFYGCRENRTSEA